MIIRNSAMNDTFTYMNGGMTQRIARAIMQKDMQILHKEIGDIFVQGFDSGEWGGDDTFFDYSPGVINAYHAMGLAIHSEDNMNDDDVKDSPYPLEYINWIDVMQSLFDNDDFMYDAHSCDIQLTINAFMFIDFNDDEEDAERESIRNQIRKENEIDLTS